MKKKPNLTSILAKIVFVLSLNIFLMLSMVEFASFDMDFYGDSFKRNDTSAITGYDKEELLFISQELVDYLNGDREKLDISVDGDSVFGERETLHMVDVKELFSMGVKIRNIAMTGLFLSGAILIWKSRWKFGRILYRAVILGLLTSLGLALIVYWNFDLAFRIFHEILFDNDLWLLNPRTDTLIQMLPLDFFYRLTLRIVRLYLSSLLFLLLSGILIDICALKLKKYE